MCWNLVGAFWEGVTVKDFGPASRHWFGAHVCARL